MSNRNIGRVGIPEFTWSLAATNLPKSFMQTVDLDFVNKQIRFSYCEVYHPDHPTLPLQQWIDNGIESEALHFETYDGSGATLYRMDFSGLRLVGDTCNFDYSSSDVSARHITVSYTVSSREEVVRLPAAAPTFTVVEPTTPLEQ